MIRLVFGGQYGSEGKGAIVAHLARRYEPSASVRTGGPQAGHSFYAGGVQVCRQVPVSCVLVPECIGYLGPGSVVDWDVLKDEIERFGVTGRMFVHPAAAIVTGTNRAYERSIAKAGGIPGSTCEGTGATRASRALRSAELAGSHVEMLRAGVVDTGLSVYHRILNIAASGDDWLLLEGTQGFWLSLWHGDYPYVTSADTSPMALLSEAGLPPKRLWTTAVIRTFPIRVGGDSGPFEAPELDWGEIGRDPELTTVTRRPRRIAAFEWDRLARMVRICQPDELAVTFCDYLDERIRTLPYGALPEVEAFLRQVVRVSGVPIRYLGVGGPEFTVREAMIA